MRIKSVYSGACNTVSSMKRLVIIVLVIEMIQWRRKIGDAKEESFCSDVLK